MKKIIEINDCAITEANEPLDATEKKSSQYGKGKVKYFESVAINIDSLELSPRFIPKEKG